MAHEYQSQPRLLLTLTYVVLSATASALHGSLAGEIAPIVAVKWWKLGFGHAPQGSSCCHAIGNTTAATGTNSSSIMVTVPLHSSASSNTTNTPSRQQVSPSMKAAHLQLAADSTAAEDANDADKPREAANVTGTHCLLCSKFLTYGPFANPIAQAPYWYEEACASCLNTHGPINPGTQFLIAWQLAKLSLQSALLPYGFDDYMGSGPASPSSWGGKNGLGAARWCKSCYSLIPAPSYFQDCTWCLADTSIAGHVRSAAVYRVSSYLLGRCVVSPEALGRWDSDLYCPGGEPRDPASLTSIEHVLDQWTAHHPGRPFLITTHAAAVREARIRSGTGDFNSKHSGSGGDRSSRLRQVAASLHQPSSRQQATARKSREQIDIVLATCAISLGYVMLAVPAYVAHQCMLKRRRTAPRRPPTARRATHLLAGLKPGSACMSPYNVVLFWAVLSRNAWCHALQWLAETWATKWGRCKLYISAVLLALVLVDVASCFGLVTGHSHACRSAHVAVLVLAYMLVAVWLVVFHGSMMYSCLVCYWPLSDLVEWCVQLLVSNMHAACSIASATVPFAGRLLDDIGKVVACKHCRRLAVLFVSLVVLDCICCTDSLVGWLQVSHQMCLPATNMSKLLHAVHEATSVLAQVVADALPPVMLFTVAYCTKYFTVVSCIITLSRLICSRLKQYEQQQQQQYQQQHLYKQQQYKQQQYGVPSTLQAALPHNRPSSNNHRSSSSSSSRSPTGQAKHQQRRVSSPTGKPPKQQQQAGHSNSNARSRNPQAATQAAAGIGSGAARCRRGSSNCSSTGSCSSSPALVGASCSSTPTRGSFTTAGLLTRSAESPTCAPTNRPGNTAAGSSSSSSSSTSPAHVMHGGNAAWGGSTNTTASKGNGSRAAAEQEETKIMHNSSSSNAAATSTMAHSGGGACSSNATSSSKEAPTLRNSSNGSSSYWAVVPGSNKATLPAEVEKARLPHSKPTAGGSSSESSSSNHHTSEASSSSSTAVQTVVASSSSTRHQGIAVVPISSSSLGSHSPAAAAPLGVVVPTTPKVVYLHSSSSSTSALPEAGHRTGRGAGSNKRVVESKQAWPNQQAAMQAATAAMAGLAGLAGAAAASASGSSAAGGGGSYASTAAGGAFAACPAGTSAAAAAGACAAGLDYSPDAACAVAMPAAVAAAATGAAHAAIPASMVVAAAAYNPLQFAPTTPAAANQAASICDTWRQQQQVQHSCTHADEGDILDLIAKLHQDKPTAGSAIAWVALPAPTAAAVLPAPPAAVVLPACDHANAPVLLTQSCPADACSAAAAGSVLQAEPLVVVVPTVGAAAEAVGPPAAAAVFRAELMVEVPAAAVAPLCTGGSSSPEASSSAAEWDDLDDEDLCVVCWESVRNIGLMHDVNMHVCMCSNCFAAYDTSKGCPMCRQPIEDWMDITHC